MDITITLIGVLFLASFILPVLYIHRSQKNKGKKFHKSFIELAEKNQIKISASDMWNSNRCIGIDEVSGKLLSLRKVEEQVETMEIYLRDISQCKLSPTYRRIKGGKGSGITERIDIAFSYRNDGTVKLINFYNINDESTLSEEQALAEKWVNKVNAYIGGK